MDEKDESNYDLENIDIFTVVNNYFLLFFGLSCVFLYGYYLQGLFNLIGQVRIGISVSAAVGVILPVYLFARRFPPGFRCQLRIQSVKPAQAFYVILATLMIVVPLDFLHVLSQRFFPIPDEYLENLKILKPDGPGTFLLTFLGLCVMIPFAEELVFRGLFQQVFSRNMNRVLAFVLAGLIFGALHMSYHLLISISVFGIFLGFIFYSMNNLTYTILAHSVFNAVSLFQLTTTPIEYTETPPFYIQDSWYLVASIILLAFFLHKIKKGASKKETP